MYHFRVKLGLMRPYGPQNEPKLGPMGPKTATSRIWKHLAKGEFIEPQARISKMCRQGRHKPSWGRLSKKSAEGGFKNSSKSALVRISPSLRTDQQEVWSLWDQSNRPIGPRLIELQTRSLQWTGLTPDFDLLRFLAQLCLGPWPRDFPFRD